jgi:hypothetical protein
MMPGVGPTTISAYLPERGDYASIRGLIDISGVSGGAENAAGIASPRTFAVRRGAFIGAYECTLMPKVTGPRFWNSHSTSSP